MRRHMRRLSAFTLVELMVVVAIIVILLALLTPALEKAVYQAQLTVCATKLHALGTATMAYAAGNRRFYMERYVDGGTQPFTVCQHGANTDSRLSLSRGFDVNWLNDPLAAPVDIMKDHAKPRPQTNRFIFGSYNLFLDWWYPGGPAMRRIGDCFTWTNAGVERRHHVLFSDLDAVILTDARGQGQANASHPDRADRMDNIVVQNGQSPWSVTPQEQAQQQFWIVTVSMWRLMGSFRRGVVDDNFLYDDLSVLRVNDVVANTTEDERMTRVPIWQGNHTIPVTNGWIHLPDTH